MAGHADGFAQRVDREALLERYGLAHDLVGGAGVELAVTGKCGDVRARLGQWLAHVGGLHFGQRVGVFGHECAQAGEKAATFRGRELAPMARRVLRARP